MDNFTVDLDSLAGFERDLQDLGTNFSANASRLLSAVSLPPGSTGLMATLAPSFDQFQAAVSAAQRTDLNTIGHLATNVASAGTTYQSTDDTSAKVIATAWSNTLGNSELSGFSPATHGVSRFSGLQLPSLPEVQENPYSVRQVVNAAIDQIAVYDERFNEAVGIKPAADYLSQLVADWEALQAIGKRIGLLGINDHVTSENLVSGTRWLQSSWSGNASRMFGASADGLGQSIADRSDVLDSAAKVVENGGACLERLVYNQAVSLTSGILQPMTYFGATFPLGAWVPYINKPIDQTMRSEITSAADALKKSAESRHSAMTAVVQRVSQALDCTPERTPPSFNAEDFQVADRAVVDPGVRKYGFGDSIWWEEGIDFVI